MEQTHELVFLKLGGSLITDKGRPYTPRPKLIQRLAEEIRQAREARPDLQLLIGHGSGSFGHQAAAPYGTRGGVQTEQEWRGFAEVAAAAARLNRLVTDALLEQDIPVLSLQPSASALCRDGALVHLETRSISKALAHELVPLVYGDVAMDEVRGGTIASTEEIFVYLAEVFHPDRILLASSVPGVLDAEGMTIPRITPDTFPNLLPVLAGSHATDVTGGMEEKVSLMVELVAELAELRVHILSGIEPGLLRRTLEQSTTDSGTRIEADQAEDE